MLDIGGTIECKFFQVKDSSFYYIYIEGETLGIEPGETIKTNEELFKSYREPNYIESPWCLKLYVSVKSKNKRRKKLSDSILSNSEFYNEIEKYDMKSEKSGEWFIQNVKASIILPIIKRKSVIPNNLIYVDEYWKT